jgi:hypothetical protein
VALFDGEILVIGGEGNGQAYSTVEAFDPLTNTWSGVASLHHARHGTQAIASGGGVYVAGGSPNQGGGNQRNMEAYDSDTPSGAPSTPGALTTPAEVQIAQGNSAPVALAHAAGNQGVFVESVAITGPDAADFSLVTLVSEPFLVGVGGQRDVVVAYSGTLDGAEATLDVVHSGGQTGSVSLLPEPGALASWLAGAGVVLLLRARAARRRRA